MLRFRSLSPAQAGFFTASYIHATLKFKNSLKNQTIESWNEFSHKIIKLIKLIKYQFIVFCLDFLAGICYLLLAGGKSGRRPIWNF